MLIACTPAIAPMGTPILGYPHHAPGTGRISEEERIKSLLEFRAGILQDERYTKEQIRRELEDIDWALKH